MLLEILINCCRLVFLESGGARYVPLANAQEDLITGGAVQFFVPKTVTSLDELDHSLAGRRRAGTQAASDRQGRTLHCPGLRARTVSDARRSSQRPISKQRYTPQTLACWICEQANIYRPAIAFTQPTSNDLAFLSRFSFARLLVPYEADSQEARELVMAARDFSIIAVQEITVADVRKAASAGFEETCSLIDKIVTSNIPVPSLSVLQHILDHIRHVVSIKEDFEPLWYMGAQLCVRD